MTADPRYRRTFSVSLPARDSRHNHRYQQNSLPGVDWEYEPILTLTSPDPFAMPKILPNSKVAKKLWDSDKALRSTHNGLFGKHQIRAYILLALGYAVVGAWLTKMPAFALLPPKYINCTPYYPNKSNSTNEVSTQLNNTTSIVSDNNTKSLISDGKRVKIKPVYNYSEEYGRSALTDFNTLCDKTLVKVPYIIYIIGLICGGLVFGYIADLGGRKMILLGSMWAACVLSIFQLLSEDYISYVFFMLFLGLTIGAVHCIAIPIVMEMFPIKTRAIYTMGLLGAVFLLDLIIPWLSLAIKNWKILQAVVSIPLILTASLYWFLEESMFWYTAQKDYVEAILSLTKIARYNGVVFEDLFGKAREFLHSKRSKGIQCDFQPLLRLEDIKMLGTKYPDFDMVDLQGTATDKKNTWSKRLSNILTGYHYNPTLSIFYPTDFLHSSILTVYVIVLCGLWLVSSLTEYGLDSPHLIRHLTDSFHANYFYTHLIQIISFAIAFPLVYMWGRRWPTFSFFLIAEVCLLGSAAFKSDTEQTRVGLLIAYFTGKFAARAAFIVLVIYTCEISPTGLRCTILGICYTFRLIGIALASPDVGELNDWMPRLIYGVLSLVLGSMALLLPETKKAPLPRTILQVENMDTVLSKTIRHRYHAAFIKRNLQPDGPKSGASASLNDADSMKNGARLSRPYDNQSTMHSIFELQDYTQDDTIQSTGSRQISSSRRMDLPSPSFYQPHVPTSNDIFRYPQSIAEDVEYTDDVDNDQAGLTLQNRLRNKKRLVVESNPTLSTVDTIKSPVVREDISFTKDSSPDFTLHNQTDEATENRTESIETADEKKENTNQEEKFSSSPKYQRTMSQDENYFSEHC